MSSNMSVTVASGDSLDVREFHVHQALSSLFEVTLTVMSENPDIDFEAVAGKEASFTLHLLEGAAGAVGVAAPRTWSGLAAELHQIRVEPQGLTTYQLRIVPTLWLLTQRRNHRIFQMKTELEIVEQLLGEWGIPFDEKISGKYKSRKYRAQYGESDYVFMSRMLEDAGISFYFDESKLVLADAPQVNGLREPAIAFLDQPTAASQREHVTAVRIGRRVRPGKYTMRDVDYRRPATYQLMTSAAEPAGVEEKLERFHYTPGAFLFDSDKGESTPFADDRGRHRADEGEGGKLAKKRLAAKRGDALTSAFSTNALDLAPGVVMSMLNHPHRSLADGTRHLVLSSQLDGTHDSAWSHHVEVRSAADPFYPEMKTPKPKVLGAETAVVVGPAGEEIHTDEFGRCRVQFHWDREGKMNEDSSCWIPVSQPWGGAGYGGSNLPRIGQEVLIDFLGGDPDRPMIMGRVYTNLQKTPYSLPANKTQSGWKSNSSPTSGGYNELMFEDLAGSELVRFQAQKDHHELVKNDRQSTIGNDRSTSIGNDESQMVGNDLTQQVVNNLSEMVGMNRSRSVGSNEAVQVGEKYVLTVGKSTFSMDKDGNIELSGVKITITGSDHVQVTSELIDLN
jgi:type VI secretion system secreted protein VgrG